MAEPKYKIGQLIRDMRESVGLTQRELGQLMGYKNPLTAKVRVCQLELEIANPTVRTLHKLSKIFDLPIDDIVERAELDLGVVGQ